MSDPRITKAKREQNQVRAFLGGRGIAYVGLDRGTDPPDVIVHQDGKPPIEIEVIEYHPEDGRVGIEKRWRQLKKELDSQIKERPLLKGVSVNPIFHDAMIPKLPYHRTIAEELVRCAEYAFGRGWVGRELCKLLFRDNVESASYVKISHDWLDLPSKEWSVLAKHVNVLYLQHDPFDFHFPSNNFQTQTARRSPYAAAILAHLERKEEKVRKAVQDGRYSKGEGPLWLLIVSNTLGDLSSFAFGNDRLRQAIEESGFDFEGSLFDRVWLIDESGGGTQCLFPWN
jgi:hypothetical protein